MTHADSPSVSASWIPHLLARPCPPCHGPEPPHSPTPTGTSPQTRTGPGHGSGQAHKTLRSMRVDITHVRIRTPIPHSLDQHRVNAQTVRERSTAPTKAVTRVETRVNTNAPQAMLQGRNKHIMREWYKASPRWQQEGRVRGPSTGAKRERRLYRRPRVQSPAGSGQHHRHMYARPKLDHLGATKLATHNTR